MLSSQSTTITSALYTISITSVLYIIDIRCPRNDTRTGSVLDITYPYYERRCAEDGDCKLGMVTSLNCSHSESGFKPFSQCVVPENATTLATDANELELAVLSGIWYPPPACGEGF